MPYPYDEEDDDELQRRQRGMGIPGAPPGFGQPPKGFGQMPMPPQDASRPPLPVQQQQSSGGGGMGAIVQGLGMAMGQQGGLGQAQRAGQEAETGRTPPFVPGTPDTIPRPQPRPSIFGGQAQEMGARTPPFVAEGTVTPYHEQKQKQQPAPAPEPPPTDQGGGGSPNYASPDIFTTPQERANRNLQLNARLQGTRAIQPAPEAITNPRAPARPGEAEQLSETMGGEMTPQEAAGALQGPSARDLPAPPGAEGGRDRYATFGGKQVDKPWWQRGLVGAGLGAMAGSRSGIGGAIGGALVGGGLSAASPQMARNMGNNIIDVPQREMKQAREARDIAQSQAQRKGEADIQGEEARTEATRTNTGWAKGLPGRYETEQHRLDAQDAREADRLGLSHQEYEERKRSALEHEAQGRVTLGIKMAEDRAQYGAGGTKEITRDEHERRDRAADLAAGSTFTVGEQTNLPQQYANSAYETMGGPAVDKEITDLTAAGRPTIKGEAYDAKMKTLLQQKEKLKGEAAKRGQDTYKGQMGLWKNAYRQMIDENGGEMPDFGKKNRGQPYTQEQAASIGKVYGLNPEQAVLAIERNGGKVLKAGEQLPVPAAPQQQQSGTTRQRQIPPPPNYGAPGFWQKYQ